MRPHLSLPIYSLALSASVSAHSVTDPTIKNANHIFNVIHDSMRQWGESLHHNGLSFFLASVPAGTQLYHGTSKSVPVNGTEWLAFEPEHAMMFARAHMGPPRHRDDDEKNAPSRDELRKRNPHAPPPPEEVEAFENGEDGKGYLHTYAAAKHLRLLYIDGMSAGKTEKGTLDSQDILLFNNSIGNGEDAGKGPGPMGEGERALKACEMAEDDWAGRIDGVLRMEAGFEIILCDFARDLTPIRITQAKSDEGAMGAAGGPRYPPPGHPPHDRPPHDRPPHGSPPPGPPPGEDDQEHKGPGGPPGGPGGPGGMDSSRWAKAVSARYSGIGGHRVNLNYDNFVSAYAYDLDLFPEDSVLPRLNHLESSALDRVRQDLTATILTHDPRESSWDWQSTTDMIVTRYSDELSYLTSSKIPSIEKLREHIEMLMAPFVDFSERSLVDEAARCATQFIPFAYQDSPSIPARAVHAVAHSVCSTLLEAVGDEVLEAAQNRISYLMAHLDWVSWKDCRGCQDNEICVVPIWPMGSVDDYEKPTCKDALQPYDSTGQSYWGQPHHG